MKDKFLFMGLLFTGGLIARAVQTEYNRTMDVSRPGAQADMRPVVFLSKNVEPAGGIGFGLAVAQGATDEGCVLAGAATTVTDFLGITVMQRNTRASTPDVFGQYESARIASKGAFWVSPLAAVAAGDPVSLGADGRLTTGAGTVIPNARWETSAGAGGLARVYLG